MSERAGERPTTPTPYYEREGVRMFLGDCREVIETLAGQFDLVVTSPPYNLGATPWPALGHWRPGHASSGGNSKWRAGCNSAAGAQYGAHQDAMPWSDYVKWQRRILAQLFNCLPESGAIFYNHKPRVIGESLWMPSELVPQPQWLRQIIIWARPGGVNFTPSAFVPTHEWILLLCQPRFRLRSRGASGVGDVWLIAPESNPHPAPFPVKLALNAIEPTLASCVLDPFMGSASTGEACIRLGRKFIGIEIEERWCEHAAKRLDRILSEPRLPFVEERPDVQTGLWDE